MMYKGEQWKSLERTIRKKAKQGELTKLLRVALAGYSAGRADILKKLSDEAYKKAME